MPAGPYKKHISHEAKRKSELQKHVKDYVYMGPAWGSHGVHMALKLDAVVQLWLWHHSYAFGVGHSRC